MGFNCLEVKKQCKFLDLLVTLVFIEDVLKILKKLLKISIYRKNIFLRKQTNNLIMRFEREVRLSDYESGDDLLELLQVKS